MIKINGIDYVVKPTIFPDKTSQVWKLPQDVIKFIENNASGITITWEFEDERELIHVCQLCDLIYNISVCYPSLYTPYLPYARQDKNISNESCFALKTFINIINPYISNLIVYDVHNPKIEGWVFGGNILPSEKISSVVKEENINFIIYPDKGAADRYSHLSALDFVAAAKVRDQLTGEITGLSMPDIESGLSILVVDDICDGGRTFTELASLIKKYEPKKLVLYVSHGIFSKGIECILESGYDAIYTKSGKREERRNNKS